MSPYKRVLLKLSGEFMANETGYGVDPVTIDQVSEQIMGALQYNVEIAIVIGAGNIWRGSNALARGMEQATADYMGMVATVINAIALQDSLERMGVITRVQTAIEMREVAEPFIRRRASRHLEKGRVVIFAAGTGNPYFTTDTAAALRAAEIQADVILKATKVDGVYDRDPVKHAGARMFKTISYTEALAKNLRVMDATAISLCRENEIPIRVFNIAKKGNIKSVICGKSVGTTVGG